MVKILTAVSGFLLSAADIDKQALLVTFDDVTDGAEACPGRLAKKWFWLIYRTVISIR